MNYIAQFGELRDLKTAWCSEVSQGPWQREHSCANVQVHQKVTIKVTVHDLTEEIRPNGAVDRHLRWNLWLRSLKICRQTDINEPNLGGTIRFEFKIPYKLQVVVQRKTLGILRIELLSSQAPMNREFFKTLTFSNFPETTWALLESIMSTPAEIINTK